MKTVFLTLAMVIIGAAVASAQEKHKLTVIVSDIQIMKGNILLLVCDKDNFMTGSVKSRVATVKEDKATIEVDDLPTGDYAIMLFHDVNENYQLDTAETGIPTEGFGFSGDTSFFTGIPSFEDCKFTLSESSTLAIKLLQL